MRAMVAAALTLFAASTHASAQKWEVLEEEAVTLSHADGQGSADIEIHCASSSDVVVPLQPGIKRPDAPVYLTLHTPKGVEKIKLLSDVCRNGECTDRPDGNVSVYKTQQKGKQLAFLAASARRVEIDAPGAKFAFDVTAAESKRFAQLCRKWK
jgi:hypothetical protein